MALMFGVNKPFTKVLSKVVRHKAARFVAHVFLVCHKVRLYVLHRLSTWRKKLDETVGALRVFDFRAKNKRGNMIKKEIRILGLDDAPFNKFKDKKVLVVGTVFRGGDWLDGVLSTHIRVDGTDSTKKLIELINKSKHKDQLQIIMLDGIAMGGFNVVDIHTLSEKTGFPVVTVIRNMPNLENIEKALKNVKGWEKKLELIKRAGKISPIEIKSGKIHVQLINIDLEKVKEIMQVACTRSLIPEPIRVAHLIASGVVKGESKGRA